MEYYDYLNTYIGEALNSGKFCQHLVLYPFGEIGVQVKQILNWWYGIQEDFIVDENLAQINPRIKSLEYLSGIDTSKCTFIITSDNLACYDEIRMNLRKYVNEKNIFDLFSCKPLVSENPRIASLELAAREIYDRKIQGAVAEAGVYQGKFAAYINRFFKDRKLYLFDTFEGLAEEDVLIDRTRGYTNVSAGRYNGTSVDLVLGRLPFVNNVEIKKGYFPNTTEGIDEQFCFVSLDMDLYQPIKAGLAYFYPKLAGGGYIFVHDCNIGDARYRGPRAALLEFAEQAKVGYVMLPDNATAVITKN